MTSSELSAAGPPQGAKAPSGGSEVREATSVGAMLSAAGPPQGAKAPLGGSAVREATSVGARVALFDLDHTLIPIDSDHAWGAFTIARGWVDPVEFKRANDQYYEDYKAGTLDVHAYVRFATAAIVHRGATDSIAAHADFMRATVHKAIQPQALALVAAHQAAGDAVVIVTATNEFVTRPIAAALGVTELIALELERDETPGGTGWFTGAIRGTPSFREGKVARVSQWLQARGQDWGSVHTTFYSDSMNDLPLLEKVNLPIVTNPDERLRALAMERGWRILALFG